ncbi:MAG: hypothetical protein LBB79_01105 [Prevotellaceae bacterium]|jgi:hypothetical protein|nr:hypothetical protein [Prevotellaceae bacterium]
MKTAKGYIELKLRELIRHFPQVRVRYEFHEMTNTHFVEVLPYEVYSTNDGYIDWENKMKFEFIKSFPYEGICFISDDTTVGIENAELTLYGAEAGYPQAAKKAARRQQGFCFGLLREKAGKEVVPV